MIKNYFRVAFRNLWKHKTNTVINIFGLTIGISCCLLIGLYIQHEVSYDNFQQKGDRTVRMIMEYSFSGEATSKGNFTSTKVAPVFKRTFPEVESAVRMFQYDRVVQYGDKMIDEENFMFADSTFFDVFSFQLLEGSREQALSGPDKIVLTTSTAKKYFGNEPAVGKILKIGADAQPYQVTGVMKDCPANSQIKFDFLASFSSLRVNQEETYWNANYTTYLLLNKQSSIASLQQKIEPFMKKEMEGQNAYINFLLEPFKSIHLHSEYGGFEPNNNITNCIDSK